MRLSFTHDPADFAGLASEWNALLALGNTGALPAARGSRGLVVDAGWRRMARWPALAWDGA